MRTKIYRINYNMLNVGWSRVIGCLVLSSKCR